MNRPNRRVRALLAPIAGALLLLQGQFVPMLDGIDGDGRAVLESEHTAATCLAGHDHTICIQVRANQAISSGATQIRTPVLAMADRTLGHAPQILPTAPDQAHRPRAPPTA